MANERARRLIEALVAVRSEAYPRSGKGMYKGKMVDFGDDGPWGPRHHDKDQSPKPLSAKKQADIARDDAHHTYQRHQMGDTLKAHGWHPTGTMDYHKETGHNNYHHLKHPHHSISVGADGKQFWTHNFIKPGPNRHNDARDQEEKHHGSGSGEESLSKHLKKFHGKK